jgi:hypothetical protein
MRARSQNGKTERAELGYMDAGSHQAHIHPMVEIFLHYLTPIAMAAVACVLLAGLVNMMRGGTSNRSQILMRWRVILQFVAVVVMMTALYLGSH